MKIFRKQKCSLTSNFYKIHNFIILLERNTQNISFFKYFQYCKRFNVGISLRDLKLELFDSFESLCLDKQYNTVLLVCIIY